MSAFYTYEIYSFGISVQRYNKYITYFYISANSVSKINYRLTNYKTVALSLALRNSIYLRMPFQEKEEKFIVNSTANSSSLRKILKM